MNFISTILKILVISSPILTGLNVNAGNITLKCHVKNLAGAELKVARSYGGIYISDYSPAVIEADSTFTVSFTNTPIERVCLLANVHGKKIFGNLYLHSEHTDVTVDPLAETSITVETGLSQHDQKAIAQCAPVSEIYFHLITNQGDELNVKNDTCAISVKNKLQAYCDSIDAAITSANPILRKALHQDMAITLTRIFKTCHYYSKVEPSDSTNAWNTTYTDMMQWANLDDETSPLSFYFGEVAKGKFYFDNDSLLKSSQEALFDKSIEYYNSRYIGKSAEALMGLAIINDSSNGTYSESQPQHAALFETKYPYSNLLPAVQKATESNRRANPLVPDPDIRYINLDDDTSLTDILTSFKGRPVILDVWATWCGPCRKAFEHAAIVQQLAKDIDAVLLYISLDEGDNCSDKVRKLVNSYGLKGHHAIVTPKLKADVFGTLSYSNGNLAIPHVALYDTEGSLLVKRFDESEEPEALAKAIRASLSR